MFSFVFCRREDDLPHVAKQVYYIYTIYIYIYIYIYAPRVHND